MWTQTSTVVTSNVFEMLDANNDVLSDSDGSILTMKEATQVVWTEWIQS